MCQRAEHLYANAPCGIMDQFVCVLAEKNTACYIDCWSVSDSGTLHIILSLCCEQVNVTSVLGHTDTTESQGRLIASVLTQ